MTRGLGMECQPTATCDQVGDQHEEPTETNGQNPYPQQGQVWGQMIPNYAPDADTLCLPPLSRQGQPMQNMAYCQNPNSQFTITCSRSEEPVKIGEKSDEA